MKTWFRGFCLRRISNTELLQQKLLVQGALGTENRDWRGQTGLGRFNQKYGLILPALSKISSHVCFLIPCLRGGVKEPPFFPQWTRQSDKGAVNMWAPQNTHPYAKQVDFPALHDFIPLNTGAYEWRKIYEFWNSSQSNLSRSLEQEIQLQGLAP